MDNRNLRPEQLVSLSDAIDLIDHALKCIEGKDVTPAVILIHDARAKVNAVATGDRSDLGPVV